MSKPMSPEIKAIRAIVRAMRSVDPEAHRRMLEWAWDRYIVHPPARVSGERIDVNSRGCER